MREPSGDARVPRSGRSDRPGRAVDVTRRIDHVAQMPTVRELTALYGNFMLGPRSGPEVCGVCFNFTNGYSCCYACAHGQLHLDAVSPISYSVAREQLHHALKGYKRLGGDVARRLTVELAAVLWRHIANHEQCVANRARTTAFELV